MDIQSIALRLPVVATAMLAAGACSQTDEYPPESISRAAIYQWAEEQLFCGMKIRDFQRENAWVESETPRKVTVRYQYMLELTEPVDDCLIQLATELASDEQRNL